MAPVPTPLQFDLFPERVVVERLDARAAAGAGTRLKAMYRVRFERDGQPHQVFQDHHGWYCADHGPHCRAVEAARSSRVRATPARPRRG